MGAQAVLLDYKATAQLTFDAGDGLFVRILRNKPDAALMYFARVDTDGSRTRVNIPPEYSLFEAERFGGWAAFAAFGKEWVIKPSARYILKKSGENVLYLHPVRKQSVETQMQLVDE